MRARFGALYPEMHSHTNLKYAFPQKDGYFIWTPAKWIRKSENPEIARRLFAFSHRCGNALPHPKLKVFYLGRLKGAMRCVHYNAFYDVLV